jgi:hypothetical protein
MSKDAERTIIGQNQELIGKVQETREELRQVVDSLTSDLGGFIDRLQGKENELERNWNAVNDKYQVLLYELREFNPSLHLDTKSEEYFRNLISLLQTTTQQSQYTAAIRTLEEKAKQITEAITAAEQTASIGSKNAITKSVDEEMKRFEVGIAALVDVQLKRVEQKIKNTQNVMGWFADKKWHLIVGATLLFALCTWMVSTIVNCSREKTKAVEVQWDAKYWQYYKSKNPQTSQKIMQDYAEKARELGQESECR